MPIFPERLHLENEDAQLQHVARDARYRRVLDTYIMVLIVGLAVIVGVAIALAL